MRRLADAEMIRILATSTCPTCGEFMRLTTEQTEEQITTTTGTCERCARTYMVDRGLSEPFEILGGHAYKPGEVK
jgi:uncharacterized protein YbaR (Trm112 family)